MATIQQNVQAVQEAYDKVKSHCMCRAVHDDGTMIRVLYPDGYFPDGVQCSYGVHLSKSMALTRILERMELHWKEHGIS